MLIKDTLIKNTSLTRLVILISFFSIITCKTQDNIKKYDGVTEKPDEFVEKINVPVVDQSKIESELKALHKQEVKPYTIKKSDVFDIYVESDSYFNTKGAFVKSDGFMTIMGLGEVKVIDLTIPEAVLVIEDKLKKYIKIHPRVSLIPVTIRKARINVLGQVTNPGSYPIEDNERVLSAIALAGGIPNGHVIGK